MSAPTESLEGCRPTAGGILGEPAFQWPCFAQRSARSSRTLPQNSSPSAVMKLGAPKIPSRSASSVCARSSDLILSDCAVTSTGALSILRPVRTSAIVAGSSIRRPSPNCDAVECLAEVLTPSFSQTNQRDARAQQAVLPGMGQAARHHRQITVSRPIELSPPSGESLRDFGILCRRRPLRPVDPGEGNLARY
jgi:hypothetical protein